MSIPGCTDNTVVFTGTLFLKDSQWWELFHFFLEPLMYIPNMRTRDWYKLLSDFSTETARAYFRW